MMEFSCAVLQIKTRGDSVPQTCNNRKGDHHTVDVTTVHFSPKANHRVRHVALDLDASDFASQIGIGSYDLVTAIEVIEHVESPTGFFRNVGRLLTPGGIAVITTPNVDSLPARTKFLITGKIRTMDEFGEPTHISPIFWDLLQRQFLPRAGLLAGRPSLPA